MTSSRGTAGNEVNEVNHAPISNLKNIAVSEIVNEASPDTPRSAEEAPVKYRHIAAVHSQSRTSRLSSDSEKSPSFLGFRNLMVIVLSESLSLAVLHSFLYGPGW